MMASPPSSQASPSASSSHLPSQVVDPVRRREVSSKREKSEALESLSSLKTKKFQSLVTDYSSVQTQLTEAQLSLAQSSRELEWLSKRLEEVEQRKAKAQNQLENKDAEIRRLKAEVTRIEEETNSEVFEILNCLYSENPSLNTSGLTAKYRSMAEKLREIVDANICSSPSSDEST